MEEIVKSFLKDENAPKVGEPAWYFTENEMGETPMCMLSTMRGCVVELHSLDGHFLAKVSKYYLRNSDHDKLFSVKKVWKTREEALADIGGHVLGVMTEIKERPTTNAEPNTAA